jgi:hypothetical protein
MFTRNTLVVASDASCYERITVPGTIVKRKIVTNNDLNKSLIFLKPLSLTFPFDRENKQQYKVIKQEISFPIVTSKY